MTLPLASLDIQQELDRETPCEGKYHTSRKFGHDDGPARWLLGLTCGHTFLLCDGWVSDHLTDVYTGTVCDCGERTLMGDETLVPIRMNSGAR